MKNSTLKIGDLVIKFNVAGAEWITENADRTIAHELADTVRTAVGKMQREASRSNGLPATDVFFEVTQTNPSDQNGHREQLTNGDMMALTMEEIGLTKRLSNLLHENDVDYLGQLITCTPSNLLEIDGFGRKSMIEVNEVLCIRGLSLSMLPDLRGKIPSDPEYIKNLFDTPEPEQREVVSSLKPEAF